MASAAVKLGLVAVLVVGAIFIYAVPALLGGVGGSRSAKLEQPVSDDLLRRGAYVAVLGDCAACHTASPDAPYAGGLALATPIGQVFSTNITPDKASGIGDYSYGDFERAVRRGIRADGTALYPAMPYPSYAHVSDADLQALYAYFTHKVRPASRPNRASTIPWPLSMRWPLMYWRWLFAPPPGNTATAESAPFDQGRYLVEGLGHCGACHTPRGSTLAEKALVGADGPAYLAGGLVDKYVANDLRGDPITGLGAWTEDDIVAFLKTGHNAKSAAFAGMKDVVTDSTQFMTENDLEAIARYLKSLPSADDEGAFAYDKRVSDELAAGSVSRPGALDYLNNCAACHLSTAQGYDNTFPALAGNPVVNAADASSLINIVLQGARTPPTATAPTSFTMPGFADRLNDEEIAQIVTFIRGGWGNHGAAVSAEAVRALRGTSKL
jgi:mono/diheme cytochrome c family protein